MQIGKAFSYPFEDPDWLKKIGVAALVMLIPLVGGIVVGGWGLEIARRVIRRETYPMPDWSDFMGHLVKGLKLFVISFVYLLPVILISACSQGIFIAAQNADLGETALTVASVASICFSCVIILYSLLVGFVLPAALGKFAATDELGAAFRFGEIFSIVRANPSIFLMALLGGFVSSIIASAGVIICVVGMLATVPYSIAINGHLWGQAYLASGQAAPVAPGLQI